MDADVQAVVDTVPSVEKIRTKSEQHTYMVQMGYIDRAAYLASLPEEVNPLAAYAVFDALANGSGDYASPTDITVKVMDDWKACGSFPGSILLI